jgi:hypothetical protein
MVCVQIDQTTHVRHNDYLGNYTFWWRYKEWLQNKTIDRLKPLKGRDHIAVVVFYDLEGKLNRNLYIVKYLLTAKRYGHNRLLISIYDCKIA